MTAERIFRKGLLFRRVSTTVTVMTSRTAKFHTTSEARTAAAAAGWTEYVTHALVTTRVAGVSTYYWVAL